MGSCHRGSRFDAWCDVRDPWYAGGSRDNRELGEIMNESANRPPPDPSLVTRLVDFLWSEPAMEDLARELLLTFLQAFTARSTHISVLRSNASVQVVSGFGLDSCAPRDEKAMDLWDDAPSPMAIRSRRTLVAVNHSDFSEMFPSLVDRGIAERPVIAVPLRTSLTTIGAWCVSFENPQLAKEAIGSMETIADVLALYFSGRDTRLVMDVALEDDSTTRAVIEQPTPVVSSELSQRQVTVLRLLAAGFTYDQIARRIGYSNSTVRMELLKMYRMLGVSSRMDAVMKAVSLDLVDHEDLGDRERIRVGGGARVPREVSADALSVACRAAVV